MSNSLPPIRQLILFAMLVPGAVMAANLAFIKLAPPNFYFLFLVFSIAILSWCSGKYLSQAGLGWIVFAWSLILLDLLTIAARGPARYEIGFVLAFAQVSLLVFWVALGPVGWQ